MKGYIITLMKSKRSVEYADKSISTAKKYGVTNIEKFPATDRYNVWKRYCDEKLTIKDMTKIGMGYLSSEIATFFSHYDLWTKCINQNEPILILEHDAHFTSKTNINEYDGFDGDILNLGFPSWGSIDRPDKKIESQWNKKPSGILLREKCEGKHNQMKPWLDGFCHCDTSFLYGAQSYIVTPNGAKKLLNDVPNGILPADIFIRQEIVDIHDLLPHPCRQLSEISYIQRNNSDETTNASNYAWDY